MPVPSSRSASTRAPSANGIAERPTPPPGYDLVIQVGFLSEKIRLSEPDYKRLVNAWFLAGQDIILVTNYEAHEINLALSGSADKKLVVRAAEAGQKVPQYRVFTREDLLAKVYRAEIAAALPGA